MLPVSEQSTETPSAPRFTDVKEGDMFYTEIAWLAQRRITTGYPDGSFRPAENTSRAAMAAYFYRLAGSPQFTAPSHTHVSRMWLPATSSTRRLSGLRRSG